MKALDGNDLIELGWKLLRSYRTDVFGANTCKTYVLHETMEISLYYKEDGVVVIVFFTVNFNQGCWSKEVNLKTKEDVIKFMELFKI